MIMLMAAFVPAASGYHLSVGSWDAPLTSPEENADDPSVSDGLYQRGLETNCHETDGEASLDGATSALAADGFCGELVYQEGSVAYEQASPPDQDIYLEGWSFDAVFTTYAGGYGLSTCIPWCFPPGGQTVYEELHNVGHTVGLTDDGDTAWAGDAGWQTYAPNYELPHATLVASQASGAYDGNGWLISVYDMGIVAFLEDAAGNPVDNEALQNTVASLQASGDLGDQAAAQVCAFTPDDEISIGAPQATFCEVLFIYYDENQGATEVGGDYNNPCSSPAFVCGAVQPAWFAQLVCSATISGCALENAPLHPSLSGAFSDGGFDSTDDYDTWHFVVAPSPSACDTAQEPGFDFNPGTPMPYIAHDLDVYEPAPAAAGVEGSGEFARWSEQVQGDVLDLVPGVDPTSGISLSSQLPSEVRKTDRVEPNAAAGEGDTSQSKVTIPRTLGDDPCAELIPSSETQADPWVDIIDSTVFRDFTGDVFGGGAEDLYLNDADHQDATNRPGPGTYDLSGKVGIFTDKNDDGDYDQAPGNSLFAQITETGAYPMWYDMWVDENGDPATEAGCRPGFSPTRLPVQMSQAGYSEETGLIQVVYLNEPTVLFQENTGDAIPFPQGDTAFVFTTQAIRELKGGNTIVDGAIQDALDKLPTTPGNVVFPGDQVGVSTDFAEQCGFGTGGYALNWVFSHDCSLDCSGDTVVTEYLFTLDDGQIGGGDLPAFDPDGDGTAYDFGAGVHQWFDVDPFDNDPDRNRETSSAPPTG